MNRTICEAIAGRQLVRFNYNGLQRVVEPYAHGFNENRMEVVRGYQVHGRSRSGEDVGWKFFSVGRMVDLERLTTTFRTHRPEAADAAKQLIVIHCQLEEER